jgi:hypothetical protein
MYVARHSGVDMWLLIRTVVPDTHRMVESLLWQFLLRELVCLPCKISSGRTRFVNRQLGLLALVHIRKAFFETAGYCSPSIRSEFFVLGIGRHASGVLYPETDKVTNGFQTGVERLSLRRVRAG